MMLSDAVDAYLGVRKRTVKPNTLRGDIDTLKPFLACIGNIQLKNLKTDHIERFFYAGYVDRVQASTFNLSLRRVRAFLTWCERRHLLRRDLVQDINRRKVVKRERLRLSPNQLLRLLDVAACERDRAIIAVAENTALRAGDLSHLRIGDVDLDNALLHVVIEKSGVEDFKPITADLDKELRRWLVYYEQARKDTYRMLLQPSWFLLPGRSLTGFTSDRIETLMPEERLKSMRLPVKRALAEMGLDGPGEGVHTIRRSVARAYFESLRAQGYDGALQATKSFLNHTNASTTEVYLGLTHEREARDRSLGGKAFLSAMVTGENVVQIADARRQA